MTLDFLLSWLAVMFPLVFSPGPANITFAAAGANLGIRGSVPLLTGIDLVFFLKSLLVGFGFVAWLQHGFLLNLLQLAGALYLVYLAFSFFKPVQTDTDSPARGLGIWDGVLIQATNIKAWILVITMFSVFAPSQTVIPAMSVL
ncbi:LysE family translocator [Microbulbifer taiwanensis]|uniref:LysE family translocator n=1 Tax=Microbulbifer taiwanensis TaxID=986746 RepID=UPI00360AB7AD